MGCKSQFRDDHVALMHPGKGEVRHHNIQVEREYYMFCEKRWGWMILAELNNVANATRCRRRILLAGFFLQCKIFLENMTRRYWNLQCMGIEMFWVRVYPCLCFYVEGVIFILLYVCVVGRDKWRFCRSIYISRQYASFFTVFPYRSTLLLYPLLSFRNNPKNLYYILHSYKDWSIIGALLHLWR